MFVPWNVTIINVIYLLFNKKGNEIMKESWEYNMPSRYWEPEPDEEDLERMREEYEETDEDIEQYEMLLEWLKILG